MVQISVVNFYQFPGSIYHIEGKHFLKITTSILNVLKATQSLLTAVLPFIKGHNSVKSRSRETKLEIDL
jgi:hypothetical protein